MKPAKPIRVLVVDDHRILRDALRLLLEQDGEIQFAGEAGDALEGIEQAVRVRPDIVLLDIAMRGLDGLQAAHRLRKQVPASKIIILSKDDEEETVLSALNGAGAAGYVIKSDAGSELLDAIRAVAAGKRYISPAVAPIVLDNLRRNAHGASRDNGGLTAREREILRLIAEGAAIKEIAGKLGISPKTVQVHRSNLAAKLHLSSTAALIRYAIKHKLLKLD
jgi:DNA-binding NarL/FixJ family response regulator